MKPPWITVTLALVLAGCISYPPALSPTKGQTADQQIADAKDCDHEVHGPIRIITMDVFSAWSAAERDKYLACMERKGYTTQSASTLQPRPTPEQLVQIRADFEACRERSGYWGASITEINPDGTFRWTGDDPEANKVLKACLVGRGRRIISHHAG
jgi:hypothetical protein